MLFMGKSTISMAIFNSSVSLPGSTYMNHGDFHQERTSRRHPQGLTRGFRVCFPAEETMIYIIYMNL